MQFEFATAARIAFGPGLLRQIGSLAKPFGRRALLVVGKNPERSRPLVSMLNERGVGTVSISVPGEPDLENVLAGAKLANSNACEFVIGFGGGSALDAGKAIAALLTNG